MGTMGLLSRILLGYQGVPLYEEGRPEHAAGGTILRESSRVRIAHLLRRAGFGATQSEMDEDEAMGLQATVDRLLNYDQVNDPADQILTPQFTLGEKKHSRSAIVELQQWWLQRMATTQRPLLEKMVLFWHGHLTSSIRKVGEPELMRRQNEFFRQNAMGRFDAILKGISRDGAMMLWLDNHTNRKGHPNENYARELVELFSMGIGNYSEQDVKEAARAFTGWTIDRRTGAFMIQKRQHDDGPKSFLGQKGNFDGDDVVDIIVRHPATGPFLACQLFSFFAYPNPEPEVLRPISEVYYRSGFSIKEMLRALFTSEAVFSEKAYRAKIKSPTEFVVGTVRALGIDTDFTPVLARMARMGQVLFDPPNPAGWPGGSHWINTSTWIERMNFLHWLVTARPPSGSDLTSLADLASGTPGVVVDKLLGLLLDGNIRDPARQTLLSFAGSKLTAGKARDLLYLVLATPEFQLA